MQICAGRIPYVISETPNNQVSVDSEYISKSTRQITGRSDRQIAENICRRVAEVRAVVMKFPFKIKVVSVVFTVPLFAKLDASKKGKRL